MKTKLTVFKGATTEAKFDNGMTLELWRTDHGFEEAKKLMSDIVKVWNMHDELVEALNNTLSVLSEMQKNNEIYLPNTIGKLKNILKKATS